MLQKAPIVRGADSMIIRINLLHVILEKWNERTMGGGARFSRRGFNFQLFDPRRAAQLFIFLALFKVWHLEIQLGDILVLYH